MIAQCLPVIIMSIKAASHLAILNPFGPYPETPERQRAIMLSRSLLTNSVSKKCCAWRRSNQSQPREIWPAKPVRPVFIPCTSPGITKGHRTCGDRGWSVAELCPAVTSPGPCRTAAPCLKRSFPDRTIIRHLRGWCPAQAVSSRNRSDGRTGCATGRLHWPDRGHVLPIPVGRPPTRKKSDRTVIRFTESPASGWHGEDKNTAMRPNSLSTYLGCV